jgi:hypothetical protein
MIKSPSKAHAGVELQRLSALLSLWEEVEFLERVSIAKSLYRIPESSLDSTCVTQVPRLCCRVWSIFSD